jgi:hypothetical protein
MMRTIAVGQGRGQLKLTPYQGKAVVPSLAVPSESPHTIP